MELLTLSLLHTVYADGQISPALDPTRPRVGELVRQSRNTAHTHVMDDHRDVLIIGDTPDDEGRVCLQTLCISTFGSVRSTTYPDKNGCYTQFRHAAPTGPYQEDLAQEFWRAGYTDAVAHIHNSVRFIDPNPMYLEGYSVGLVAIEEIGIEKPVVDVLRFGWGTRDERLAELEARRIEKNLSYTPSYGKNSSSKILAGKRSRAILKDDRAKARRERLASADAKERAEVNAWKRARQERNQEAA